MPTPLETIRKGEEELDHENCKAGDSHREIFNAITHTQGSITVEEFKETRIEVFKAIANYNKQTLKATLQALWDEAEGRKRDTPSLETCALLSREELQQVNLDVEHNQAIQTYQDSLLELIKAI